MTQESDFQDQQVNVLMRQAQWEKLYGQQVSETPWTRQAYGNCLAPTPPEKTAPEPDSDDPSPYLEVVRAIPWMIGAALAFVGFVSLTVYIVKNKAWQMPDPVLTFVAPAHTGGRK